MNIIEYRDAGDGLRVGKVVYQTRPTVFLHIQITGSDGVFERTKFKVLGVVHS